MSGWPDPDKPGYPANYEVDGFHWLFDPENKKSYPEIWVAEIGAWAVGDAWTPRMVVEMGLHYQGPVMYPTKADTLRAENARLREALDTIGFAPSGWSGPDLNECILIARKALEVKP
jgi:hypothetical protein